MASLVPPVDVDPRDMAPSQAPTNDASVVAGEGVEAEELNIVARRAAAIMGSGT